MREMGVKLKTYTFVAALKACSSIANLEAGKEIHAHVIESGSESNIFVSSALVNMYIKCGSMVDARQVFEKMPHHDVVSWNAMIMGFVQWEMGDLALQLYRRMQLEGFKPDARTFVAALKACLTAQEEGKQVDGELVKVGCLEKGKAIHSDIVRSGFESNVYVASTLVDMYLKCGSMVDAWQVFETMPTHNVVSWTAMIMGYVQMEKGESALQLYSRMLDEGFIPNDRTYVAALKACSSLAIQERKQVEGELMKVMYLEEGRAIHSQVLKSGFESNIFIANTLISMYAKCGCMVDARLVFERMPYHDLVSWNAMVTGYAQSGEGDLALQLYAGMQHEGFAPDARTFAAALKACGSLATQEKGKQINGELLKIGCLAKGRAIHSQVAKSGFESEVFVANTLMDMYVKCGSMVDAHQVFEKMPSCNVMSWTIMIMGYAQMEKGELALQLYACMQHEGFAPDDRTFVAALKACGSLAVQEDGKQVDGELVKVGCLQNGRAMHCQVANSGFETDIFVANALINMYIKCGSIIYARQVFDKIPYHDVVSWNIMIMGYVQKEEGPLALQLYKQMQYEGFTPDAYTFVAALMACGSLPSLKRGKEIHTEICRAGIEGDAFITSSLIDMYGKCGSMVDAQRLFDRSSERDAAKWSALIAGYTRQGDSERVFDLFERMQQEGVHPIGITFVSILTVCSRGGLVDKGQKYFQAMCLHHGVARSNEHYNCMVDLLGRTGQLDEAMAMVIKMPLKPDIVTWMTFLGACQKLNNMDVGSHAFECAVRLDRKHAAAYVLMTNMHAPGHGQSMN